MVRLRLWGAGVVGLRISRYQHVILLTGLPVLWTSDSRCLGMREGEREREQERGKTNIKMVHRLQNQQKQRGKSNS